MLKKGKTVSVEHIQLLRGELQEMLSEPNFLFPLAAGQVHFRLRYPGMTSAALLEIVFTEVEKEEPKIIPPPKF